MRYVCLALLTWIFTAQSRPKFPGVYEVVPVTNQVKNGSTAEAKNKTAAEERCLRQLVPFPGVYEVVPIANRVSNGTAAQERGLLPTTPCPAFIDPGCSYQMPMEMYPLCDQMLSCEWPQYECPYAPMADYYNSNHDERNKTEEQTPPSNNPVLTKKLEELETMIKNNTQNQEPLADTLKQILAMLQQKAVVPDEAVALNLSATGNETQPGTTHHMKDQLVTRLTALEEMLKSHNQKPSANDEMVKLMMNILEQRYNQPCDWCCHQAATPVVQAQLPAIHVHCSGQDSGRTPTVDVDRGVDSEKKPAPGGNQDAGQSTMLPFTTTTEKIKIEPKIDTEELKTERQTDDQNPSTYETLTVPERTKTEWTHNEEIEFLNAIRSLLQRDKSSCQLICINTIRAIVRKLLTMTDQELATGDFSQMDRMAEATGQLRVMQIWEIMKSYLKTERHFKRITGVLQSEIDEVIAEERKELVPQIHGLKVRDRNAPKMVCNGIHSSLRDLPDLRCAVKKAMVDKTNAPGVCACERKNLNLVDKTACTGKGTANPVDQRKKPLCNCYKEPLRPCNPCRGANINPTYETGCNDTANSEFVRAVCEPNQLENLKHLGENGCTTKASARQHGQVTTYTCDPMPTQGLKSFENVDCGNQAYALPTRAEPTPKCCLPLPGCLNRIHSKMNEVSEHSCIGRANSGETNEHN